MLKRRLILLVLALVLIPIALSLEEDADSVRVWCEYDDGDQVWNTGDDLCQAEVLFADAPPATCAASPALGPAFCSQQGDVFCYAESDCQEAGSSWDGPKFAYNVNWDTDSVDCACNLDTWFNTLGSSTSSTYDWCCGDDFGSDDWATYSGNLGTSTSLNCRRCLNGADQGTVGLIGNGNYVGDLTTDQTIVCYWGDITCSGGTAADGSASTRYGNGYISGNVCYYGNIGCSDGSSSHGSTCVMSASEICGDGTACFDCYTTCYARQDQYTCFSGCVGNNDAFCAPTCTCEGVACVPKLANGAVCDENSDCISDDCNPSADGTSYCTRATAECAYIDSTAMDVGDLDCFNNDIYRCDAEDSINVFIDCATVASVDSDTGDFPLVAGFVTDTNDACAGVVCTSTDRRDFCTAEDVTDYLAVGATFGTSTTDCNTEDTCVNGQEIFRDFTCIDVVNDYCDFVDRDRDADISYCLNTSGTCSALIWTGSGGQQDCCLDDINEYVINETDSPLNDGGIDEDACCDSDDRCVDDSMCFNDLGAAGVYYREINEGVEYPGGTDTNDLEICDDGSIDGGLNDWHDADNFSAYCALARDPSVPGTLLQCNGTGCWFGEGEELPFGGYETVAGIVDTECCGDDDGEFFIMTNLNIACCNDTTDFVHSTYNCTDVAFARYLHGYVIGEQPDGSYTALENVRVVAKWESFLDGNSDFTDVNGFFNITVPTYNNYTVYATKTGYTTRMAFVNATDTVQVNFSMDLTSECKSDCSGFDFGRRAFVCNRECDNVNGCKFDDTVNSSYYGQNIKEVCHEQTLGWQEDHNSTHNLLCCNSGYINVVSPVSADIQFGSNVSNAHTIFAGTIYYDKEGVFYGVYVTGVTIK